MSFMEGPSIVRLDEGPVLLGQFHLGGILLGYIYFKGPRTIFDPNLIYTKYLEWQLKRKRSRFKVLDGNKKKDDDKPTYH